MESIPPEHHNHTETKDLSHSHIPVKHLLKQLEVYRSTRRNRDIRPDWLTDLIGRLSDLFDPEDEVARVGFECRLTEDAWELILFLGSTEIVGGPDDGRTRFANFRLDLLTLMDNFSEIDEARWLARPQTEADDEETAASYLQISGRIDNEPLRLKVFAAPPTEFGPGIRKHQNGHCEPA